MGTGPFSPHNRNVLAWMLSLWKPHRVLLLPLVVLTVANAVSVAALPLATKGVFDLLAHKVTYENMRQALLWLAEVGLIRFFIYAMLQNTRAWLNTRLEWSVRSRLFRHIIRLGPGFFSRFTTGDLITRLTDDISDDMKLSWFLCSGVFRFLEAVCVVVVVAIAMLRLNVHLALWCLVPLPILFWVFIRVSSLLDDRFERLQTAISRVNSELEATFSGIRLVKSYTMERRREQAFAVAVEHRQDAEIEATRGQVMMESLYAYSWQIAAATVLLVGGRMVILGEISLGDFVAFNGFALSMTFPMFDLGGFLTKGRQSLVFIERLRQLEAVPPEVEDGYASSTLSSTVEGADLSYAYSGSTVEVLKHVSLRVQAGEFVAIVGRVGQGKTTIMRLLLRLIDPSQGTVLRGGRDLRELPLHVARAGIGYVPQDPVVLSDTLLANIRFGRLEITEETARWAVQMAQLQTDVDGFQEGLATRVGPRGTQLSGGQKQRLSLARALAGRPQVLLLDDCTASLDAATEAQLWDTLRRELPTTTIIGVTHRTAELERADMILVLGNGGEVVQSGTHADLIATPGEYHTLYERWQKQEPH